MRNLHAEITARIVARLKAGVCPWRQPWSSKGFGIMPRNAVTDRAYSGVNVLLLWSRAQESDFSDPRWLTFNQARDAGGNVRKGEKGGAIITAAAAASRAVEFMRGLALEDDEADALPLALAA